jgi:hypothetical protein
MSQKKPTANEEVYLYWFACRVMGLAMRKGRQNILMSVLRRIYNTNGRHYIPRTTLGMATDIRNLGDRLVEQSQDEEKFEL